ncbi:MAG: hypothetical protein GY941_09415 [Planctomycetes bacterium]|nr:hypothetical protein [Planctomycetota bacterium]
MGRDYIRSLLGKDYESFSRTGNKIPEIDSYDNEGLQLNYDEDNKLEFIEAIIPSNPTFENIAFTGRNPEDVYREITEKGYLGIKDDVGYDFPDLGIGIYIREGFVEAVSIYRKGYYDD